jgi:Flp pilus assembly protein CpaB
VLLGHVVTTRVHAGHFVARTDVQAAVGRRAGRSMSFAIDKSRALDGQLSPGDRVDVISVDARTDEARYVATNVEVLRVGGGASNGPLTANDSITITLTVDEHNALDLAAALHEKDLTLVRATGATPIGEHS